MPTRKISTERLSIALLCAAACVGLPSSASAQFGAAIGGAGFGAATAGAGAPPPPPASSAPVTVQGGGGGGNPPLAIPPEEQDLMRVLEQVQRQRAILQGRIDLLDLQNRLADAERRSGNADSRPPSGQAAHQDDPRILRVRGVGTSMEATFMLSNGGIVSGRVGDTIGGFRIISIDISGVVAATGEGANAPRKRLGFVGDSSPGLSGGGGSAPQFNQQNLDFVPPSGASPGATPGPGSALSPPVSAPPPSAPPFPPQVAGAPSMAPPSFFSGQMGGPPRGFDGAGLPPSVR